MQYLGNFLHRATLYKQGKHFSFPSRELSFDIHCLRNPLSIFSVRQRHCWMPFSHCRTIGSDFTVAQLVQIATVTHQTKPSGFLPESEKSLNLEKTNKGLSCSARFIADWTVSLCNSPRTGQHYENANPFSFSITIFRGFKGSVAARESDRPKAPGLLFPDPAVGRTKLAYRDPLMRN